jgi:UDP-N-acetylmuramoylalanine--D-glutamate ligase
MNLNGKKVGIIGLGISGISALELLSNSGAICYPINSGDVAGWASLLKVLMFAEKKNCYSQNESSDLLSKCDLIVISPGVDRAIPELNKALSLRIPVINEIELAYNAIKKRNKKIIAVTGTNGKTTTVKLLTHLLKGAGKSVFLAGNIGTPLCEYLNEEYDDEFIVLELSSFQLESLVEFKADIAVILNISPSHGERYAAFQDYFDAKLNIKNNMESGDCLILPQDIGTNSPAEMCIVDCNDIQTIKKNIGPVKFQLLGDHNLLNLYFSLLVIEKLGFEIDSLRGHIESFSGVEFRLQRIENNLGLKIYNDAKSTNWDATKKAIMAFEGGRKNLSLIIGGKMRKQTESISEHIVFLEKYVKRIFLIGETADTFFSELKAESKIDVINAGKLKNVFKGSSFTEEEVLLFSPAYPSFDQFKNYIERGKYFSDLVRRV